MKQFGPLYMAYAEQLTGIIRSVGNVRDFMAILETAVAGAVDPRLFESTDGPVDTFSEDAYLVSGMLNELNETLGKEGLEFSNDFSSGNSEAN